MLACREDPLIRAVFEAVEQEIRHMIQKKNRRRAMRLGGEK
jgi:hypothetical protein